MWNTLEYCEPPPFLAASSQAAKWTFVSIAEPYARMVSRRVPSVIERQQQSGLLISNRVDTKSLFRTITKNHIASSAFRGIDSVLNGGT
jgi:hypothetical protein